MSEQIPPATGVCLKSLMGEEFFNEMFPDGTIPPFRPSAIYILGLDTLLYLAEDCSYTEVQINRGLSVLKHPHDDRIVGVELHGFQKMFEEAFLVDKTGS